ncbi:RNA exonuclease NEF sp [Fasciola gigantica]|uniref:RNA exonuclease NEF sp n=1 Tax=Fasciola gigantica TaxID=46835 RepID=A0A504Z6S7_FASGI|nr:RNA exonuclease NEF sp [Fasciola gigantica]
MSLLLSVPVTDQPLNLMSSLKLRSCSKKDKKPSFFLNAERLHVKQYLYASDIQQLLGLVFFPQQYAIWPDWCVVKKPGLIKAAIVLFCDRLGSLDCCDSNFTSLFGKPINVCHPKAYQCSWDEEITSVPKVYLSKHALEMADQKQPITAPAARRIWLGDSVNRVTRIADQICHKSFSEPVHALETSHSANDGGRKRPAYDITPPFVMPEPGSADAFDRTKLLLNLEQMIFEHVPLPPELDERGKSNMSGGAGFVASKSSYTAVHASSPMFAVDCEMVQTKIGSELARITMVDELDTVVFDRLVRPENPVEDYVTRFSGITRDMLEPVTTTVRDIQRELQELLPPDAILVGHSISNDLLAMRIYHPYLIDTSVIYNLKGARAAKAKLRFLAEHFLGRTIQAGSAGHSSAEDAIATMDLVRLKLSKDLSFGDVTTTWRFPEGYDRYLPSYTTKRQRVLLSNSTETLTSETLSFEPHFRPDQVHPLFRLKCTELLSLYRAMGGPLHFCNRLLQDCSIPYSYWPHFEQTIISPVLDVEEKEQEESRKDVPLESSNRISSRVLNWILELSSHNRLVMANLNCPVQWDQQKCTRKVAKFCHRLYRGLQTQPSLIVFVCTGDGEQSFAPPLDVFSPSNSQTQMPYQRVKNHAFRKCYICITSESPSDQTDQCTHDEVQTFQ